MVRVIKILIFYSALLCFGVTVGCKKYPDGPSMSLRTRSNRLAGTWYIESYSLNGVDQTSTFKAFRGDSYLLYISKNGTYNIYGFYPDDGTCAFEDKFENMYLQSRSTGTIKEKYIILKLEYTHLWLKHTKPNGDEEVFHYIAYR
jgi:hypothetical protein